MGQCIDILEKALVKIEDDGSYILDEDFMIGIFDTLHQQLPPFLADFTHMFDKKMTSVTADKNNKVVHFAQLRKEQFFHESESNEGIGGMTKKLGSIASATLLCPPLRGPAHYYEKID